jgi:YVTN family beta-propeller protein
VVVQLTGCASGERAEPDQRSSRHVATTPNRSIPAPMRTHPAGRVFATTLAAGRPFGIAVGRSGTVYCTLLDAGSLVRSTLTSGVTTLLQVGSVPTDVAFSPAGTWAYVTNQHDRSIGIVDVRSNKQVEVVPVEGDPFRVLVGPEGQVVYATTNSGSLVQIDAQSRSISWTLHLGGNLNGLAINPGGTLVYVGDVNGKVYEVTPDGEVIRSFSVSGQPQGLALSPRESELYVAGEAGYLIVLDLESGVEVARTGLGTGAFGIAVTADQKQLWLTAPRTGKVFILDRKSRIVLDSIVLGGIPRRLAFDETGATAVVADEAGSIRFVR